jgi:hypothetical protein
MLPTEFKEIEEARVKIKGLEQQISIIQQQD